MAIGALIVAGTSDTPERGLFGVFIALGGVLCVPLLLIPVLGIFMVIHGLDHCHKFVTIRSQDFA